MIIEGKNPVIEALKSDKEFDKILLSNSMDTKSVGKLIALAKDKNVPIFHVDKKKIDEISETNAHQGVVAYVSEYKYWEIEDVLDLARKKGEKAFILILDEITDPHNLGSILRTANATGVHGVIIPKRNNVGLNATVAKTSAGAIEYVPVVRVSNLVSTIKKLKKENLWIIAADSDGQKVYYEEDFNENIAFVIGSEGKGIGKLVKENCDFILNIPMLGEINSLNASVAASVLMYETLRQRSL